jgi:hypothetical protein
MIPPLVKVRRPALNALAFITLSLIFYFSFFKVGFHFNFPAAGTKEFLR